VERIDSSQVLQIGDKMANRNRSEGWTFAKVDGHNNEEALGVILRESSELTDLIHQTLFKEPEPGLPIVRVDGSKHVESIFEDSTTSKIDIALDWGSTNAGLSVKKSNAGQVWLVSLERFLGALEIKLGNAVPDEVKLVLSLFIGGSNLGEFAKEFELGLVMSRNERYHEQEVHQNRLVFETIEKIEAAALSKTIEFIRNNLGLITELMFFDGLACDHRDSATLLIYNQIDQGKNIFTKTEVLQSMNLSVNRERVAVGDRNGGSTLKLPTGFLQMHKPNGTNLLQFHHKYDKLIESLSEG